MEFKLFGIKLRIEVVLLCIALGMIIGTELLCSCVKKDGFAVAKALYNKTLNNGIPSLKETFDTINNSTHDKSEIYEQVQVPLPDGRLFFYANNDFKPECCKHSTVSGTGGCACETREQLDFIQSRGGNKTYAKTQ
jgi:hypothetical protein